VEEDAAEALAVVVARAVAVAAVVDRRELDSYPSHCLLEASL
jgi:hypothetical protein